MKICVAGQGAFGQKHLDALKRIPGAEVVSLIGGNPAGTEQVARKYPGASEILQAQESLIRQHLAAG